VSNAAVASFRARHFQKTMNICVLDPLARNGGFGRVDVDEWAIALSTGKVERKPGAISTDTLPCLDLALFGTPRNLRLKIRAASGGRSKADRSLDRYLSRIFEAHPKLHRCLHRVKTRFQRR
jgi:hypothetical protein